MSMETETIEGYVPPIGRRLAVIAFRNVVKAIGDPDKALEVYKQNLKDFAKEF